MGSRRPPPKDHPPMATVTCPSCGLPRAPDLIDAAACPVCGTVGSVPAAVEVPPDPAGASPMPAAGVAETGGLRPPPAEARSRPVAGPVFGFAAGLAVGVGGVLGWQNLPATGVGTVAPGEVPAANPEAESGGSRPRFAVAPMPREVVVRAAPPVKPPGDVSPPLAGSDDPIAEADPPPGPVAKPDPGRPAALTLDNPDGTSNPYVRPGSTLVLRGRVKKLVVGGLDGGAVLDCSELDAAEVVVSGPVGGGSRLTVRAPNGRVTVPARIDGRAAVGGGAAVEVVAKEVGLHGRVDGAGTRVAVRLTDGGTLTFAEVDGPARLEYAADRPGGPEPRVIAGRVGAGAVVRKVE
ncbi:MAG: hypothetical protein K2X87_20230 [Gemmataceae bacterium]|nr:hypothetical protein [Gemmataceae bacterium]